MTFLSFFLFKNKQVLIRQFVNLARHKAKVLIVLNQGPKFWVRSFNDIMIIRQAFSDRIYQPLFKGLKGELAFLDIGAYIGDSAIYASKSNKFKKIVAVEPVPDNVKFLKLNLTENKITNVLVLEKAVSRDSVGISLYIFPDETKASFKNSPDSIGKITVPTCTLGDLLKLIKLKIIILKFDIEGGEYDLLLNASSKILSRIQRIMIEAHLNISKDNKMFNKLLIHLSDCGFNCKIKRSFFNPFYPLLYCYRTGDEL